MGNVIQQVLTVIGNHMGLFQTIVSVVVTVVSTVWQTLAPIISAVVDDPYGGGWTTYRN